MSSIITGKAGPLTWQASCKDRKLLGQFHDYLDQAFPLPDEKETLDGYQKIWEFLAQANATGLSMKWGGVEEWVLLAEYEGHVVGGANVCAIGVNQQGPMSVHGSFWFFLPEYQGRGWSRWLFTAIEQLMGRSFGNRMLLVYEVNDPLGMDPDKLKNDFLVTGMHPIDRLAISRAWGDRILDLDYIQPALGPGQVDETGLCLMARGMVHLDPSLLHRHFGAFFTCSVLKGGSHEAVSALLDHLERQMKQGLCVNTLDLHEHLAGIKAQSEPRMKGKSNYHGGVRNWLLKHGK